jgi:pentatricopeptide repeat protein
MGMQAIETYRQIPSEQIDGITYICILNACSHSGLVEQAISIFKHIQMKTNKIYTTMVHQIDLFFFLNIKYFI